MFFKRKVLSLILKTDTEELFHIVQWMNMLIENNIKSQKEDI